MAQGQRSAAAQRRAARGIEQEKNPNKQKAGLKGAIATQAKAKGVSIEEEQKRIAQAQGAKIGAIQKQTGAIDERFLANLQRQQQLKKDAAINYLRDNVEKVGKRLVKLALGQGEFENSPASVQRLAMLDVLSIGGISSETTGQEQTQKKISDLSMTELMQLIDAAKGMISNGKELDASRIIDVTPSHNGE